MITALFSNSSASALRGSGLMGDVRSAADDALAVKGNVRDKEPAAAPVIRSLRAGNTQPLSGEAILALQADETSQPTAARRRGDGLESSNTQDPAAQPADDEAALEASTGSGGQDAQAAAQGGEEESADPEQLTEEEQKQVDKLQQRDREVRAHEAAHARVGGPHAGAPSYTFQQGPDGKRYAIGGEVSIDTSAEQSAEATIRKMQTVIRAATAPAEPSPQDLKVAQQARAQLAEAQAEARMQRAEELQGDGEDTEVANPSAKQETQSRSATGQSGSEADEETPGAGRSDAAERGQASDLFAAIQSYQSGVQLGASGNRQAASNGLFA